MLFIDELLLFLLKNRPAPGGEPFASSGWGISPHTSFPHGKFLATPLIDPFKPLHSLS